MTIRHRSTRRLATLGLVLGVLMTLFAPHAASGAVTSISLDLKASGLDPLTQVTSARDGSGRLFLVERRGTIRVFKDGAIQPGFFLDMRSLVEAGGERGLLGLAFHPELRGERPAVRVLHAARRRHRHRPLAGECRPQRRDGVVVQATPRDRAQLRRRTTTAAAWPSVRATATCLRQSATEAARRPRERCPEQDAQPARQGHSDQRQRHRGGAIRHVQRSVEQPVRRPEWPRRDLGIRPAQPVADLVRPGQRAPVHRRRRPGLVGGARSGVAGSPGGRNYGWRVMEGRHCYNATSCSLSGDTLPVTEYSHASGRCSITGGYVYRGPDPGRARGALRLCRLLYRRDLHVSRSAPRTASRCCRPTRANGSPRSARATTGSSTRSRSTASSSGCSPRRVARRQVG